MAGVLSFSDYLGGPDNIQVEQIFPSTQRTYVYNFNTNIQSWDFAIDYQTLVINPVTYDRNGIPNFSSSRVIGYFPKTDLVISSANVNVVDDALGIVRITLPANMYTGPIIPDARSKVPVTIVGVTWTTAETPAQTNTHRWAFIQCYEPDVTIGDPTLSTNPLYTAFTVS